MSMAIAAQTRPPAPALEQAREATRPRERPAPLPALTGLRFAAALGVVFYHFGGDVLPAGPLRALAAAGPAGVGCFFVLSGFVLAYSYLPAGSNGLRTGARAFYRARLARLYPVYLLALLCALGPALWSAPSQVHVAWPVVGLATVLLGQAWLPFARIAWNPPGWSLSAEAVFYLLLPVLARPLVRLGGRGLLLLAAGCWLLSLAICAVCLHYGRATPQDAALWFEVGYGNPLLRLPEFVFGLALGRLFLFVSRPTVPRWTATAGLCATACLLALALCAGAWPGIVRYGGAPAPFFGLLIWSLACGRGLLARLLGWAPCVVLGEASYSLYLLHYPLHDWLTRLLGGPPALVPYLALCVACSVLALRLVERPARAALCRHSAARGQARPG